MRSCWLWLEEKIVADSCMFAGKSYPVGQGHGMVPLPTLATLIVAMCISCLRVAMLYVLSFFLSSPLGTCPLTSSPMHSPKSKHTTNSTRFSSHQVFQWQQDNPGVWPFHCHIAWHVSGGLYANIMEQPAEIKDLVIPSTSYQNCRDWAGYSGGNLLPQIDSGL